jgi:hypothetical protein
MIKDPIQEFLWHGYLPSMNVPDWCRCISSEFGETDSHSAASASKLLDKIVQDVLSQVSPPYIVPLSGGWDSRIVLGSLKENTNEIVALTLGNSSQLDYEIGSRVAKAAGVTHVSMSTESLIVDWGSLSIAAKRSPWTYLLDSFFLHSLYRIAIDQSNGKGSIWSGFLGEALTGGHYHSEVSSETISQAQERFAKSQLRTTPSQLKRKLVISGYPESKGEFPYVYEREYLDLVLRQRCCIAPIVLGMDWEGWKAVQGIYSDDIQMVTPFADKRWAQWWLSAPRSGHKGQILYWQMAIKKFPDYFAIPSKQSWGCLPGRTGQQLLHRYLYILRNRINKKFPKLSIRSAAMDNYIDFEAAFRNREDYIEVLHRAFRVLSEWNVMSLANLNKIWIEHYNSYKDHSLTFQVLLGLAVNLDVHGQPNMNE